MPRPAYRPGIMLGLLTLLAICGTIDRALISIVQEEIKREFLLSDTALGFVAGPAFAIAHAIAAIPFGLFADRVDRRKLVAAGLALYSAATAICGVATSFVQLLMARMGVGLGEAAAQSATVSMISDLFPANRRATAMSIFHLSVPVGAMIAGAVGGLMAASYGWRAAMLAAAAPGLLVTLCLLLFGRTPARVSSDDSEIGDRPPGISETIRVLFGQRSLFHIIVGFAIITLAVVGQMSFSYSFFIRVHHMDLSELGPFMGVAFGTLGIASTLASGFVADRIGDKDPARRLWVVIVAILILTPIIASSYLAPKVAAFVLYLPIVILMNSYLGPVIATAQSLTPPRMRSTMAAIMFVTNGVIGVGLGPLVTGGLSDALSPAFGDQSLNAALIVVSFFGFWAAAHFYLATRSLVTDLKRAPVL